MRSLTGAATIGLEWILQNGKVARSMRRPKRPQCAAGESPVIGGVNSARQSERRGSRPSWILPGSRPEPLNPLTGVNPGRSYCYLISSAGNASGRPRSRCGELSPLTTDRPGRIPVILRADSGFARDRITTVSNVFGLARNKRLQERWQSRGGANWQNVGVVEPAQDPRGLEVALCCQKV